LTRDLKGRDFFSAWPIHDCDRPRVLLVDELNKVEDGFETMLLEIFSAWKLSIPEFGTLEERSIRRSS
jgi:hypothetical protein